MYIGLDTIIKQDDESRTELIYGIDVYGTEKVKIKVKIQSGDFQCTTNEFTTYSDGSYYSAEHTRITNGEKLGNCYRKAMKGGTASIKIVSVDGKSLVISKYFYKI